MKITKNTKPLSKGTLVMLPGEELLVIIEYIEAFSGVYRVQYLEFDGSEYIPTGDVRTIAARELVGGEVLEIN